MAPGLTRLDAELVEGKYHLLLHLYESSAPPPVSQLHQSTLDQQIYLEIDK